VESVHEKKRHFACKLCDKRFSRPSNLQRHTKSVHEKKRPFVCSVCKKSFLRNDHLNQHIKCHPANADTAGIEKCTLVCEPSKMPLETVHQVADHQDNEHTCPVCSETFEEKIHLETHFNKCCGFDE
jgi:uncharacterized Zn-finger protein